MAEPRLAQGLPDPPDRQRPHLGTAAGEAEEDGAASSSGQSRAVPAAVQAAPHALVILGGGAGGLRHDIQEGGTARGDEHRGLFGHGGRA